MLSVLLLVAAQSAFTVTNATYDGPVTRPEEANLVFSDEFNGGALDTGKWAYDTAFNKQGWFNKERQYYSAGRRENLRLENGNLIFSFIASSASSRPRRDATKFR